MTASVLVAAAAMGTSKAEEPSRFLAVAREITADIQARHWMAERSLYRTRPGSNDPEPLWGGGILFSMVVAAARHDPATYRPLVGRYFDGLEAHWDTKARIPGYEPCPTSGGGNDKYYDDNAWMVLTFTEAHALTRDPRFLRRAYETLAFVMSGWDETLGGGIWWHEGHKDGSKNTCSNAPAAAGCLLLGRFRPDRREAMVGRATDIIRWTRQTLQEPGGLYMDSIRAEDRRINRVTLTYNSALMLRAELMLFGATGDRAHLDEATRIGAAADRLCHQGTGVYRDPPRWSHLMVEADLELHRRTGDTRALERARANGESFQKRWKEGTETKLIDQASMARALWLLVDQETEAGRAFWKSVDEPMQRPPAR